MFTMICDFADAKTQSITQFDRTNFMATLLPPSSWRVSVGRLIDLRCHGYAWKRSFALTSTDKIIADRCNSQLTTLAAGKLLLHTFNTDDEISTLTIDQITTSFPELRCIWPLYALITSPPPEIHSVSGFLSVAQRFKFDTPFYVPPDW